MSSLLMRQLAGICLVLLLNACSWLSVEPNLPYSKTEKLHLYKLQHWLFEGRVAITAPNDAWSASIDWAHTQNDDNIRLSGPLGQGATRIYLTENNVTIDRGNGKTQSSNNPQQFINQQLGLFVPVDSLSYWVLGLPDPKQALKEHSSGFNQLGWSISYQQQQTVENETLPRKITVSNDKVKLKLIIDQWQLKNTDGK